MSSQGPDNAESKRAQRREWDEASLGWKKWWSVFEQAAQKVSNRLIELANVRPGTRVLDLATGMGEPALTAARRVGPAGRVVAVDQSSGMLAAARERAAALSLTNVAFVETDGELPALHERDFEAALCRWGLMFMRDLPGTLGHIRDLLIPGGRFATAVWDRPENVPLIGLAIERVREIAGLPGGPDAIPDPCRLWDNEALRRSLAQAGFKDIEIEPCPVIFEFESASSFLAFRRDTSAPLRRLLKSIPPEIRQKIDQAVAQAMARFEVDGGRIRMENRAFLASARRP